jgi:hypothetical protein
LRIEYAPAFPNVASRAILTPIRAVDTTAIAWKKTAAEMRKCDLAPTGAAMRTRSGIKVWTFMAIYMMGMATERRKAKAWIKECERRATQNRKKRSKHPASRFLATGRDYETHLLGKFVPELIWSQ